MRVTAGGLAAAVLVLVVVVICLRLGFWQLDRLEQRRAMNAEIAASLAGPPVDLPGAEDDLREDPLRLLHRPARARGRYDPGATVLLRGRFHEGRPGVHVVTPLRIGQGTVLMVNRGWVPAPDGATLEALPAVPSGWVTVRGVLDAIPRTADEGRPSPAGLRPGEVGTFLRLDLDLLERHIPGVLPLYLTRLPAENAAAGPPIPVSPAELDDGPHLGYAVQWFSFAVIAVIGFVIVVVMRVRRPTEL